MKNKTYEKTLFFVSLMLCFTGMKGQQFDVSYTFEKTGSD